MVLIKCILQVIPIICTTFIFSQPLYAELSTEEQAYFRDAESHLNDKEKALFQAVERGDHEAIWKLSNEKVNLDVTDQSGNTPLHKAAMLDELGAIEALYGEGANIEARNNQKETPLDVAKSYGNPQAEFLLQGLSWQETIDKRIEEEKFESIEEEERFRDEHDFCFE